MNSEKLFFMYAFPCSQALMQLGRISLEKYSELRECFLKGDVPEREDLEDVFKAAFVRIKKLAEMRGKDYWDFDIIKEYWESYHNENINMGDGFYEHAPEGFKDICRTQVAEVIELKKNEEDDMLIVEYKDKNGYDKKRVVFANLVPDVKIGDKVKIHYGYAVEKDA